MEAFFGAVVTGDINASSRMSSNEARLLESILERSFIQTYQAFPKAKLSGFSGFRGDSWQFSLRRPEYVLRATLHFRARLIVAGKNELQRRLQTSAAVGFGRIDYLPDDTTSSGGGEAFELSGRRLDKLRRRMPGMGVAGVEDFEPYLDMLFGVVDAIVRQWTASQAEAVALALRDYSQSEIASKWQPPVSQQAIQKHLSSASWPALEPAVEWVETTLKGCFRNYNQ